MKQDLKNQTEMLGLINKIQAQLTMLDKKIDALMSRSMPETKATVKPVENANATVRPNDSHKGRTMYSAICADCKKECSIPFKPSGDRPVYCKDCFSRRKMVSMSKIQVDDKPKEIAVPQAPINKIINVQKPAVKKKKTVIVKKPVAKKKTTPKKK